MSAAISVSVALSWLTWVAALAVASAAAVRFTRAVAIRKALLDVPNERSSHRVPVPRLGGAAFAPLMLVALAVLWAQGGLVMTICVTVLLGASALYAVSLADDFRPLPSGLRFGVQMMVASGTVWVFARQIDASLNFFSGALISVAIVGALNIYNFMDGIDGIAGIQGGMAALGWGAIGMMLDAPAVTSLSACLLGAVAGFLTVNWPPAKMFMGDAGSTLLGYLLSVAPLLLFLETAGREPAASFSAGVLLLWPFLADGTFTILRRLRKRENIFQAHRSHLYQRLVIAGRSHREVALAYGLLAAIGAILACWVIERGASWAAISAAIIGVLFGGLWAWTISEERKAAARLTKVP